MKKNILLPTEYLCLDEMDDMPFIAVSLYAYLRSADKYYGGTIVCKDEDLIYALHMDEGQINTLRDAYGWLSDNEYIDVDVVTYPNNPLLSLHTFAVTDKDGKGMWVELCSEVC